MNSRFSCVAALGVLAMIMVGCTTTEEANQAIQSKWIGQPVDSFFTYYGPPVSSFPLNDGGTIYTWVGGETTRYIPAQYQTPQPAKQDANRVMRTTTETQKKADGSTVTTTKTSSFGISAQPAAPQMISPARTEDLFCELQITTGADKIIRMLRATKDTDGEGFSFSRCAEVMGVKK
ncbi:MULTISPECIES: hypothetical protein [Rhizobium/Agrobacterium group]|uniref:Lipoprotein n=2 Tax=Neorhizobium TaxID=1525371 RepID=A0ABV0LZ70_9HYPH|nr:MULTISPECIES: hypothetical protein [Rhizobium/Agrobacterium group]MCC2612331.1 hypothetical protein [Neorhizobium petrolearium]WGI67470.1 hypothetical protein QEO92_21135 [Neorhizobium petrolearium]